MKKFLIVSMIAVTAVFASCKTMVRAPVDDVSITAKDFTVVGVVSVAGRGATYRDLMLEAQKLGGDAVVNVFHDKVGII